MAALEDPVCDGGWSLSVQHYPSSPRENLTCDPGLIWTTPTRHPITLSLTVRSQADAQSAPVCVCGCLGCGSLEKAFSVADRNEKVEICRESRSVINMPEKQALICVICSSEVHLLTSGMVTQVTFGH